MEGNLPYFSLFYFVFGGNFRVQAPWGASIWGGDLKEGFLRYEFGGAHTWTGLFSEFYGILGFFDYPIFPELAWKTTQP